jgi:hypothetical protein
MSIAASLTYSGMAGFIYDFTIPQFIKKKKRIVMGTKYKTPLTLWVNGVYEKGGFWPPSDIIPAATYFPTQEPVQYHRRGRA